MKKLLIVYLLFFLIASCGKEHLPVSNSANPPITNLPATPGLPILSKVIGVFNFLSQSSYTVRGYTTRSRYILYDNGTFVLHYDDNGGMEYRGSYTMANNLITFGWEGWSTAGPWGATGMLRGDTLTVSYNTIMMLSDFEDAVYLRKP